MSSTAPLRLLLQAGVERHLRSSADHAIHLGRGTIGAAMSAAISGVPSIALSWGLMTHYKPPGKELVDAAAKVSCQLVQRLYDLGWGEGANKCDVYSVNVPVGPLSPDELSED